MKLKYYLRGLGTGILFATIILFIAYSYRMSDGKIKERAKELGMVYAESTEDKSTDEKATKQTETKDSEETNVESEQETTKVEVATESTTKQAEVVSTEKDTTVKPTETVKPTVVEATTIKPTEAETTTIKQESQTTKPGTITECVVTVGNRTSSLDVAKQLANAGIIDRADDFDDYLVENGYASKIQNGQFRITKGMTYAEIAKAITEK